MARKVDRNTGEIMDGAQPPLIALSEEEVKAAGRELARKVRELAVMRAENTEIRRDQKTSEEKLVNQIEAIAETIRTAGR